MLKFLSRDSSNAKALVEIKRKSDAFGLTSKAKTSLPAKKVSPLTVMQKVPSTVASVPFTCIKSEGTISSFVQQPFYMGFVNDVRKSEGNSENELGKLAMLPFRIRNILSGNK